MDQGETAAIAGARELIEETGLHAENCHLLGELHPLPGYIKSSASVVLCTELSGQLRITDTDEIDSLDFVEWEEIDRMLIDGRICEMQAAAGLLLAKLVLNRERHGQPNSGAQE